MSLLECSEEKQLPNFDEMEYFEGKQTNALRAFEKEVYFKVPVKTFSGACRNHKKQTGMKIKGRNASGLNKNGSQNRYHYFVHSSVSVLCEH